MKLLVQDGGGVFGRIQSRIMMESGCIDKFDAHIGTSIGATMAEAYALGIQKRVSPEFFDKYMYQIFKTNWLRRYNPLVSKYPDTGLNDALRSVFGSLRLGDAKKPVFMTAADVGQKNLKVFSSLSSEDQKWPAWEVGRAATAAETYFKPMNGYADGGVFVNNPSMAGVVSAIDSLSAKPDEIEILSIGTGDGARGNGIPRKSLPAPGRFIADKQLNRAKRNAPQMR